MEDELVSEQSMGAWNPMSITARKEILQSVQARQIDFKNVVEGMKKGVLYLVFLRFDDEKDKEDKEKNFLSYIQPCKKKLQWVSVQIQHWKFTSHFFLSLEAWRELKCGMQAVCFS